jgi:predicted ABC-class ATPase
MLTEEEIKAIEQQTRRELAALSLADEQNYAEQLQEKDYAIRPYLAFSTARSALKALVPVLEDDAPELAEAIKKLTSTLNDGLHK